jgi:hypothetical protein
LTGANAIRAKLVRDSDFKEFDIVFDATISSKGFDD